MSQRRYGWLLWGAWLVFLIFPVLESLDADTTVQVVTGLVGTAGFSVLYVLGFFGLFGTGPLAGRPGVWVLVALVVLAAATAPAIGLGVLSFTPFLVAFGMFGLPRSVNWWWAGAVLVTTIALPVVFNQFAEWFIVMFILVAVSLGTGAGRLMVDQSDDHDRVRDQLTVTAERDRVARDVHDILGHSLTVVSVKAELAARLVDLDPARARAELDDIQNLTRQALSEVRATVGGLRAAVLDDELGAAAVALQAAGIEANLPDGVGALDPRHRGVAAWVLREAVTNVVRHSGASHCTVTLDRARLEVVDNGRGAGDFASGNGLRGLCDRVDGSGGRLQIGAGPDGGTALEVTW